MPVYVHKVQPLAQRVFSEMLELELEMASRNFTLWTISQLADLYGKAIEYYDSVKDPISSYFLEKLQITLQSRDSLKLIMKTDLDKMNIPIKNELNHQEHNKENQNNENLSSDININSSNNDNSANKKIKKRSSGIFSKFTKGKIFDKKKKKPATVIAGNPDTTNIKLEKFNSVRIDQTMSDSPNEDEDLEARLEIRVPAHQNNNTKKTVSQLRLERAKSAYRYMKILEQKDSTQKMLADDAERYFEYATQNDNIIRKDIINQYENLKKKLEDRKLRSRRLKDQEILAILANNNPDTLSSNPQCFEKPKFNIQHSSASKTQYSKSPFRFMFNASPLSDITNLEFRTPGANQITKSTFDFDKPINQNNSDCSEQLIFKKLVSSEIESVNVFETKNNNILQEIKEENNILENETKKNSNQMYDFSNNNELGFLSEPMPFTTKNNLDMLDDLQFENQENSPNISEVKKKLIAMKKLKKLVH